MTWNIVAQMYVDGLDDATFGW